MKKRSIGIHINNDNMFTVRLCQRGDNYCIEQITSSPLRRASDTPAALLQQINYRLRRYPAGISVPNCEMFYHNANISNNTSNGPNNLTSGIFPLPLDDIITSHCQSVSTTDNKQRNPRNHSQPVNLDNNGSTLTVAIPVDTLSGLHQSLQHSPVKLTLVDSPVFALHSAVLTKYPATNSQPGLIAYTDSIRLIIIVSHGNQIIVARNIPSPKTNSHKLHRNTSTDAHLPPDNQVDTIIHEIDMTWISALKSKIPEKTPVILAGNLCTNTQLIAAIKQRFHCQPLLFQPDIHGHSLMPDKRNKHDNHTTQITKHAKHNTHANQEAMQAIPAQYYTHNKSEKSTQSVNHNDTDIKDADTAATQISDNTANIIAPEIAIAYGLAIRTLNPNNSSGVNFIRNIKDTLANHISYKRDIISCLILLAAVIAISVVSLFIQKSQLENQYASIKNNISQLFRKTLPKERNIVDEVAQMETALQKKQQEYNLIMPVADNTFNPLNMLNIIATHTPPSLPITLQSININRLNIYLTATCPSFDAVYKWQRLLQQVPIFKSVKLQNPHKITQSNNVAFSAVIGIKNHTTNFPIKMTKTGDAPK